MMKTIFSLFFGLFFFILLSGSSIASGSEDPPSQKTIEQVAAAMQGIKFESLMYLSYQDGESGGADFSKFTLKRGYLTLKKEILPWLSTRLTTDLFQVSDPKNAAGKAGNDDGSYELRIKYLYGLFKLPDRFFLTEPAVEVGMAHMPWIDFEEHINYFRMQDTVFIERNGIFNSADAGITFNALLGGSMEDGYQRSVSRNYPGRYGSVAFGIYNGGGYHASEKNENKVIEGRLTVRPLPDILPGLQLSYFGLAGKGNSDTEPDWSVNLGFVSYETPYLTLTGTYYSGTGSQSGGDENDKDGNSLFVEIKPVNKLSLIGRYDHFDPNTGVENDENDRYIAGMAYMLGKPHKNMVLLDYDFVSYEEDGKADDKRIQLTLQLSF